MPNDASRFTYHASLHRVRVFAYAPFPLPFLITEASQDHGNYPGICGCPVDLLRRVGILASHSFARELARFEVHQMEIGLFLQMTVVPVILVCLLTMMPYFRRLLQDQTVPHATLGTDILPVSRPMEPRH